MINKKYIWPLFIVMILAQLYIPAKMIMDSQSTITEGTAYKFKTQPRDPYDPFRGKYVDLRYEVEREKYSIDGLSNDHLRQVRKAFAQVSTKPDGYAEISKLTQDINEISGDYIEVTVRHSYEDAVSVDLPYNRFYMEESITRPTEIYVQEARRDTTIEVYGVINIKNGNGVLTEVMVNGRPIAEVVREEIAK